MAVPLAAADAPRDRTPRRLCAAGACGALPVPRARHGGDGPHGAPWPVRRAHPGGPAPRRSQASTRSASPNSRETEYTRISGGQRQLALIARALAQDAPAIVMDEPTASLDFGNQVVVLSRGQAAGGAGLAVRALHPRPRSCLQRRRPRGAARWRTADRPRHCRRDVLTPERLRAVYGVSVVVEQLSQGQIVCAPDYGLSR